MPELPEVEAIARILSRELTGQKIEAARVRGIGTLKSFDPPFEALVGETIDGVSRRGKHLIVSAGDLALLVHLMSAGRLQLFGTKAGPRDRTVRLTMDLDDGRQLRLREFGTKQSAWAKLLRQTELDAEPWLIDLGPEAWPDPPDLQSLLDSQRPLHSLLRDQKVIAGIGRSWVDEILHAVKLSPFRRGNTLTRQETDDLAGAMAALLGDAIDHYDEVLDDIPDKLPMPLKIHRHEGEPCPRCGDTLRAVKFEDHEICYCPTCQTDGKVLKDRRLSRLLK